MIRLLQGDCVEVMRSLPEASVDAIVTDPPYGIRFMGKAWDGADIEARAEARRAMPSQDARAGPVGGHNSMAAEAGRYDRAPSASKAFQEFSEAWATEAFRVLKPGGHLLSFASTRTYHRMTSGIEDAGFEIRDQIGWLFGSGFPKSLDVSTAIDKVRAEDVEPLRVVCRAVRAAMDARGLKSKHLVERFGNCDPRLIDHWAARDTDSQPSLPTWGQWETLRGLLPELTALDAEAWRLNGRKGTPGAAWSEAEILGEHDGPTPGFVGMRFGVVDKTIREPSDAARQWQGWGTALKPAWEPIVVARKPLIGTVAANVLAHGTGAINVDACRVPTEENLNGGAYSADRQDSESPWAASGSLHQSTGQAFVQPVGRWPANVIHDGSDEVLAAFPQAGGAFAPVRGTEPSAKTQSILGEFGGRAASDQRDGGGSAARFFYTAKANGSDRNDGGQRVTGSDRNTHPTVKPTDLMRHLCRLVTPPGGTLLDPFAGSGSTLKAAELEGFSAIGIELDPAYIEIARRRIASDAPLFAEVTA